MDNTRKGFKLTPTDKDKYIADLEQKISVLLSCKNCPENKGGFICQKEYEDKCLAQKIQYIKELKEEIENLKKTYCKQRNKRIDDLQKENAELKQENKVLAQNLEDTEILNKTYEKRFSKLEKENAELKGEADSVLDNWCKGDDPCPHLKKRDEQLTKAKELLERLLITSCNSDVLNLLPNCSEVLRVRVEAEQFIKDSEVEK